MKSLDDMFNEIAGKIGKIGTDKIQVPRTIDVSEEETTDRDIASETFNRNDYNYMKLFDRDSDLNRVVNDIHEHSTPERSIFIDGTLRTVMLFNIRCGSASIPVFLTNIIVGALERVNGELRPLDKNILYVLLSPEQYIWVNCNHMFLSDIVMENNSELRLDNINDGKFYDIIVNKGASNILFSNITMQLRSQDPRKNMPNSPIIGKIRQYASDRARVLMRMSEYAMLKKLYDGGKIGDHTVVFMDGPIGLLTPYSGLLGFPADNELKGSPQNQALIYDLFKNTIGLVKNVIMVPPDLTDDFGLYFFTQVSGLAKDLEELESRKDNIREYILSWYYKLRAELLNQYTDLWSSASAYTRVDILVTFLLNENYRENWYDKITELTGSGKDIYELERDLEGMIDKERLKELIRYVKGEAYPLPPTSERHRMLVESYGIYETEQYIKSSLLHPSEIVAKFRRQLSR